MIEIIDGNKAAAYGALLSNVKYVPCFPITPQTSIIESIAKWKADGIYKGEFKQFESEHSVMSAAIGSEAAGCRTFTASSSQGIMLMHEMLPVASGMRLPLVMVNVSRGLSAPITLWCDHNDVLAMRDSGFIIFMCETNQEVLDSVIIAYKVCEDEKVLLPAIVNMDGFIHSNTRTEVEIPSQSKVDKFLPKLDMEIRLDTSKPMSVGVPVMAEYMYFRQQLHKAQLNALEVIDKAHKEFYNSFGRRYEHVEKYKLNDADIAFVMMGANSSIAKESVDRLRKKGFKVGLLRVRVYRPFPEKEIREALMHIKKIAVLDQNICPGMSGILYPEIRSSLHNTKSVISNFIISLGGRPISRYHFKQIALVTLKHKHEVREWVM